MVNSPVAATTPLSPKVSTCTPITSHLSTSKVRCAQPSYVIIELMHPPTSIIHLGLFYFLSPSYSSMPCIISFYPLDTSDDAIIFVFVPIVSTVSGARRPSRSK